jgi:pimeloyl-ACP methyl ester carboxylesterase
MELREVPHKVGNGRVSIYVQSKGNGPPVIYFHAMAGLVWDTFLNELAADHTVHAPLVPGLADSDWEATSKVVDVWDLVVLYEELIDALGVERPIAIGASFGGMLACELAAHRPDLFSKLVLLSPMGLWRDDAPVVNPIIAPITQQAKLMFHSEALGQVVMAPPADPLQFPAMMGKVQWALGCTSKFLWPIPDKGLARRIHRVRVPTLLVWGKQDQIVPAVYADTFSRAIKSSEVRLLDQCGHVPQVEQMDQALAAVREFIRKGAA